MVLIAKTRWQGIATNESTCFHQDFITPNLETNFRYEHEPISKEHNFPGRAWQGHSREFGWFPEPANRIEVINPPELAIGLLVSGFSGRFWSNRVLCSGFYFLASTQPDAATKTYIKRKGQVLRLSDLLLHQRPSANLKTLISVVGWLFTALLDRCRIQTTFN